MTKRICLVVLSGILALAAFGCAKQQTAVVTPPDASPVTVQAETQPTSEPTPEQMMTDDLGIKILLEQDDDMKNNYSVIAVNDAAPFKDADGNAVSGVAINTVGAKALIDWLMSDAAAVLIADYGVAEYGEALFTSRTASPSPPRRFRRRRTQPSRSGFPRPRRSTTADFSTTCCQRLRVNTATRSKSPLRAPARRLPPRPWAMRT